MLALQKPDPWLGPRTWPSKMTFSGLASKKVRLYGTHKGLSRHPGVYGPFGRTWG